MKNYALICAVIGACAVVADASFMRASRQEPCPPDFTGNIPNPEDCHSFYICHDGVPWLTPCPAGLCFNPVGMEGGTCDHCESVPGCGGSGTGAPPTTTQAPPSPTTTATPEPPTTTQAPPVTSSPPPETTTTRQTDPPSTPEPTTTTLRTTTSNGEDLSCPPDVPYIYLPYPGDCNKFYYCQNGVNTGVYNCGLGLWFQFRQQVCTAPWGSSCEQ